MSVNADRRVTASDARSHLKYNMVLTCPLSAASMSPDKILLAVVFAVVSVIIVQQTGDENQSPIPRVSSSNKSEQVTAHNIVDTPIESVSYDECIDHHDLCSYWSDMGFCQKNHTEMLRECPVSCDSCDDLDWSSDKPGCPKKYPSCQDCVDKSKMCPNWIKVGECKKHPGYMVLNCAKSCKYCHLESDYQLRCPMNEEYMKRVRSFKNPGDLNAMFERIVSLYNAHKNQTEDDGLIPWDLEILSHDPWILRFDNFFTEEEAHGIIDAAGTFERSTDVGKKDETGHFAKVTSTSRTSKNAWCHEKCWVKSMCSGSNIFVEPHSFNLSHSVCPRSDDVHCCCFREHRWYSK